MANRGLFGSSRGRTIKATNAVNAAGGVAYALSPKQALARYAMTGCMSNTFYVKAQDHLAEVLRLAKECDSEYIAKLAIFARKEGYMKDMPALLMAFLASRATQGGPSRDVLHAAFPQVIDNGRMVRNFVQIMRSGRLGRKSLGTGPRDLVRSFLVSRSPHWLFRQLAVGQAPSGRDIVRMVHPKGPTPEYDALFGYMAGLLKEGDEKWASLPPLVAQYEAWKADRSLPPPPVPFELLTAQPLTAEQWAQVIRNGRWHFVKKNINTAIRQGAFKADPGLEKYVADKIREREALAKARVMPHDLLSAYLNVRSDVPRRIVDALHDAMEIAVDNVPVVEGPMIVIVDVSGSMRSPISGRRPKDPPSKVRCVDVGALFASAMLRKNREAEVMLVDTQLHLLRPEPRDTVMTNARLFASCGGGGTYLSLALEYANAKRMSADAVVIVSDYESWADRHYSRGTGLMNQWEAFRSRNRNAKLVCIDITPAHTHQASEGHPEILHVSGWSDAVFRVTDAFLRGDASSWAEMIDKIDLGSN